MPNCCDGHQKKKNEKSSLKQEEKEKKDEKLPSQYLLEVCVSPETANSDAWRCQFVPFSVQLFLADRPSHIIVRNSWNPVPFEHFPSRPATCSITTPHDEATYVVSDAKVWSRSEIRATCEDCDFVAGNMWFYIPPPNGPIRSPDDLFDTVIQPLLDWSRKPLGTGELIGSADDALGLLYWNIPAEIAGLAVEEVGKMAERWAIRVENPDAMIVDLDAEEFADPDRDAEGDGAEDAEEAVPRGGVIPIRDYFWVGIGLAFLQLLYLISKFEYFQRWFD